MGNEAISETPAGWWAGGQDKQTDGSARCACAWALVFCAAWCGKTAEIFFCAQTLSRKALRALEKHARQAKMAYGVGVAG